MLRNNRLARNILPLALIAGLTAVPQTGAAQNDAARWVTVKPHAISGPLTNPGNGVASFHDGYGEHLTPEQYPDTGIEYQRFYWSELEPQEGKINFALVDAAFAAAARHHPAMNVGLRVMALDEPASGSKIPDWLIKKGIKGNRTPDGKTFVPDLDDPVFIRYARQLLNALGQRYDGNPELAYLDIGLVGSWGEWHNSNFPTLKPLLERYTPAQLNRYVDMHFSAFPRTPKVMLISGGASLPYAAQKGAGWRADCWGDWHNFSTTWSHMRDDYPQRLQAAQAAWPGFNQGWEKAPVSLEICGYMAEWKSIQHYTREEVQASFDWALAQHVSTINLKSREVPKEYRDIVDNALVKMGYRFRVLTLTHEAARYPGQNITLNGDWSNDGVAPVYLRYNLAWRLRDEAGYITPLGTVAGEDIRHWLPGKHRVESALMIPQHLTPGRYYLDVALTDDQGRARINLANEGKLADGWYHLSSVTVN
ncbi:DUF4832 domain-containing protein [Enterobacillus tribolii]|uniref:Beta-galactosidase-like protein n=1 Tax=Enterobacillus tribolii TaxID=1487935 RepID=A0A370QQV8_9GAMM|nr:DUF4832 domain-containing protein [Enterobacillus tribolii]MBW7981441.1 DUF4832 domain-containing protein [Enterobacillus tribolii]RDK90817.1 beta-galactosidase-like protein [Enterobacillus tribolii]